MEPTVQIETVHLTASKWVWGLVSFLFGVILLGGGAWLTAVQQDNGVVKEDVKKLQAHNAAISERLKGVETQVDFIATSQQRIEHGVERVNEKLDDVIIRRKQ